MRKYGLTISINPLACKNIIDIAPFASHMKYDISKAGDFELFKKTGNKTIPGAYRTCLSMRLKSETINDLLVVKVLDSAVDAGNALELKADLLPLVEKHRKVAIDMGKVKFMDSSGVGAMLSCLRAIHQNSGELRLFSVKPNLYQLFKLVRLDTLVGIHENRKTALEAFDRNSDANA